MDIISASLATVISTMSGTITDTYADNANTRLTRQVITHQGQEIHFEHLVWRIRDNSVCNNKRGQISEYSRCTLAAKAAFNEIKHTRIKTIPLLKQKIWSGLLPGFTYL